MTFLLNILRLICEILTFTILLRAVMSWISPGHTNMFTDILYHITEPILAPLRRIMPKTGMFDFSPLVAVVVLQVISTFLL